MRIARIAAMSQKGTLIQFVRSLYVVGSGARVRAG